MRSSSCSELLFFKWVLVVTGAVVWWAGRCESQWPGVTTVHCINIRSANIMSHLLWRLVMVWEYGRERRVAFKVLCKLLIPSVVLVWDNINQGICGKWNNNKNKEEEVAPLRQRRGNKEEVCFVIERTNHSRERTDNITKIFVRSVNICIFSLNLTKINESILVKFLFLLWILNATTPLSSRLICDILIWNKILKFIWNKQCFTEFTW